MNPFEPYIAQILAAFGQRTSQDKPLEADVVVASAEDQEASVNAESLRNTAYILKDAALGSPRRSDEEWDEL